MKLMSNLNQFNREIKKFAKTIPPEMVSTFQKKLVLETLRRLVMRTPVDTGRARGNWQVTIDNPATGQSEATDEEGTETITKGLAALRGLSGYQVVWISNNVDYIEFLEHGSSDQAPQGMMSLTIAELRTMFRKAS